MTAALTGSAGLAVLVAAIVLGVVLDVPGGPTGWRRPGPGRVLLLLAVAAVAGLAVVATWLRLHP